MAAAVKTVAVSKGASQRLSLVGMSMILLGLLVFMIGSMFATVTTLLEPVFPAILGLAIMTAGGVVLAIADPPGRERLGEAPVIRRFSCPCCGASSESMNPGRTKCAYCGTAFIVG